MRLAKSIFLFLILGLAVLGFLSLPVSARPPAQEPCPPGWVCDEDPQVKCCGPGGASEGAPCTSPWQRWEWQNCSFGAGKVCVKYKVLTDFCYTTDACYAVSGYPSSNSTGLIWPGKCDTFVGGACHWGPSAYKRCCQGATPKPCSISAPYDYECDQGGGVVWGTVCTAPCTCTGWTNQSCGGWTCGATQRHQTRDCNPDGCLPENQCVADVTCDPGCDCTAWVDQGCGPAGGCAETEMYQTRSCNPAGCDDTTRCASDPDCGGSECSITCGIPCCPNNWWDDGNPATKNCGRCGCPSTHSAQCNGDGTAWDCVPNPGLCPDDGPDPEYHKVCSGGSCVTVEGAGSDQCSYNYECSHWDCDPPGGGVGAVCRKYSTPGTSKCGSDSDCRPPECVQTTINGGATYTNSRDVTLSLSASNADEMRFRNEDPNWSGWETYRTRKSWTLSNGDGTKTVTAQYRNDIGRSKGIAACKDSITLDTTPPISSMTPLSAWSTDYPLTLSWSGSDNFTPANELKYWLQYNKDSSSWIDLLGSQTIPTGETSWDFYGEEGVLYCFRVRARDLAGNWEDWPFPYDTCTTIDLGPPEISAGWEIGVERPSVWATVYDEVSGIDYSYPSSLNCEYSLNGGANWTAAPHDQTPPYNTPGSCSFSSADPLLTVLTLYKVPFDAAPPVNNMVRFSACDVAGSCLTNTYTIDNRTTGAWVQTFGGDVHGNANLQLRPAPD